MTTHWPAIEEAATSAEPEALPSLIGALEAAKAVAWARLTKPPEQAAHVAPPAGRWVGHHGAAEAEGLDAGWLLRHTKGLKFRRDLSRRNVQFDVEALHRWLMARRK